MWRRPPTTSPALDWMPTAIDDGVVLLSDTGRRRARPRASHVGMYDTSLIPG